MGTAHSSGSQPAQNAFSTSTSLPLILCMQIHSSGQVDSQKKVIKKKRFQAQKKKKKIKVNVSCNFMTLNNFCLNSALFKRMISG